MSLFTKRVGRWTLFVVSWGLLLLLTACGDTSTATNLPGVAPTNPTPVQHGSLYTNSDHVDKVNAIAWSPNGKYIASGSSDKTVEIIEALTGKVVLTYKEHTNNVT